MRCRLLEMFRWIRLWTVTEDPSTSYNLPVRDCCGQMLWVFLYHQQQFLVIQCWAFFLPHNAWHEIDQLPTESWWPLVFRGTFDPPLLHLTLAMQTAECLLSTTWWMIKWNHTWWNQGTHTKWVQLHHYQHPKISDWRHGEAESLSRNSAPQFVTELRWIKSAVKQWSGTCIESVIQCHTILWVSVLKVRVWRCMPNLIVQNMLDVATSPPQISWILEVGDFNIPRGGQQLCSCPAMGIAFASATWKNGVIGQQLVVCGQRQTCTQISIFASWLLNYSIVKKHWFPTWNLDNSMRELVSQLAVYSVYH